MKVYGVLELHDLSKKLVTGERLKNYDYVKLAQTASTSVLEKIKSFLMTNQGEIILLMPTKMIFCVNTTALDELEQIQIGYQESLKTPISLGLGTDISDAEKALSVSRSTGEMEFWNPKEDKETSKEENSDPNQIPDKQPIEVPKEVKPTSLEEEVQAMEQWKQALTQAGLEAMASVMPQPEPQPQPGQDPNQPTQGQPQEDPAQQQAQGGQVQEPEQDARDLMMGGVMPKGPDQQQDAIPAQGPETEEKTELDPEKSEADPEADNTKNKVAGLLSTIKMFMPEMVKLADKSPESAKMVFGMISSALRIAKAVSTEDVNLKKARIPLPRFEKSAFKIPVGTVRNGKLKVKDPETKKELWRGVRTGLMTAPDGSPLSAKVHNQVSHDNELGKDEHTADTLYRIHVQGQPITKPMTLKDLHAEHGHPRDIEKDPNTKIVPYKSQPKKLGKDEILEKPYVSDAQRKWAHTSTGTKALGGEVAVHEWDESSKGKKLPKKVK